MKISIVASDGKHFVVDMPGLAEVRVTAVYRRNAPWDVVGSAPTPTIGLTPPMFQVLVTALTVHGAERRNWGWDGPRVESISIRTSEQQAASDPSAHRVDMEEFTSKSSDAVDPVNLLRGAVALLDYDLVLTPSNEEDVSHRVRGRLATLLERE